MVCSGNDDLVDVRMFPKTDGPEHCSRNWAVQRLCDVLTEPGSCRASGFGDRQPPHLLPVRLSEPFLAELPYCAGAGRWGPSWREAACDEYPSSASLGSVTKLGHTQESV